MEKAIQIAKKGMYTTSPNPKVGCIIVKNNNIIGTGWHKKPGMYHAEIYALKTAGINAKGATAYITLEPCSHFGKTPPCCIELTKAGIIRVVIAHLDPNPKVFGKGLKWLQKNKVLVTVGILSKKSKKLNKGFFQRMKTGIPWLQLKLASSVDGRIALKNGCSKWITSHYARNDVHNFRKITDAIISSSTTVLIDNPKLTVRYNTSITGNKFNCLIKQPIRIIIDSKNRIKPFHECIKQPGKVLLIRLKNDNCIWPKNTEQIILNNNKNYIDLIELLKMLGQREINNVWIEAGTTLSNSFLELNIINELIIYIAPKLLGSYSKPLFILKNYLNLCQVPQFKFENVKQIGPDIRLIMLRK